MSEQDNRKGSGVNYDDLVFDWSNPSMTTRPVRRRTEEPEQTAPAETAPAEVRPEETTEEPVQIPEEEETAGEEKRTVVSARDRWEEIRRKTAARKTAGNHKSAGTSSAAERLERISRKKKASQVTPVSRAVSFIRSHLRILAIVLLAVVVLIGGTVLVRQLLKGARRNVNADGLPDYVQEQYLTINSYSRPGIATDTIRGIVIHYTAVPGRTAQESRDYFEGLSTSHETRASSNFIIGIEGEVIAAVPLGEVAYASNNRNMDTISIECCHPDEEGKFTDETYASLVKLTAWLCEQYGLSEEAVIRHYDITRKMCPRYYVEHEDAWKTFLTDVKNAGTEEEES